jgi:hypothetical protein
MLKVLTAFLMVLNVGSSNLEEALKRQPGKPIYVETAGAPAAPSPIVEAVSPRISVRPTAVLWRNPGTRANDLYYGSGGKRRAPQAPFVFLNAMTGGTQPKFVVRDARGVEWRVKTGAEARPETAATRFVWAAGYFTDDDYVVSSVRIANMPKLRGVKLERDGTVRFARFELNPYDADFKGSWNWGRNPFTGSRELNGLKVVMGLLNNWDLKDANTSIYAMPNNTLIYMVGDLGKTFGRPRYVMGRNRPGDIKAFGKSRVLGDVDRDEVNFKAPGHAPYWHPLAIPHAFYNLWSMKTRNVTHDVPRAHVKWMGQILSRLSDRQIQNAFEGAGYSADEVRQLSEIMRTRIAQISDI